MKRLINIFLIIFAIVTLVGVSSLVRAQQNNEKASANTQKGIDYVLPYPGILPDSALYNIKMLRDKVVALLISDPLKKAEFYLLMADKRINSGKFLIEKSKDKLAVTTISKGQNYLDLALTTLSDLKNNSVDNKTQLEKIKKATLKHEEVLKEMLPKVSEETKPAIRNAIERNKQEQERIKKL